MDWTSIKSGQDMPAAHSTSMVDVFSSSISAESTLYQTPIHAKRVEQQLALESVPDTRRHSLHVQSLAHQNLAFDQWPRFNAAFKRVLWGAHPSLTRRLPSLTLLARRECLKRHGAGEREGELGADFSSIVLPRF
jgi:hypothetical protein